MYSTFYPLRETVLDDDGVPRLVQQANVSIGCTVDVLLFNGETRCIPFEEIELIMGMSIRDICDSFGTSGLPTHIELLESLVARLSFPALHGEGNEV